MTSADQRLPNILILSLTVRCGGRHNETCAAMLIQIGIEVGNPEVVGVADLFVFVHGRQTERKTSGVFA